MTISEFRFRATGRRCLLCYFEVFFGIGPGTGRWWRCRLFNEEGLQRKDRLLLMWSGYLPRRVPTPSFRNAPKWKNGLQVADTVPEQCGHLRNLAVNHRGAWHGKSFVWSSALFDQREDHLHRRFRCFRPLFVSVWYHNKTSNVHWSGDIIVRKFRSKSLTLPVPCDICWLPKVMLILSGLCSRGAVAKLIS